MPSSELSKNDPLIYQSNSLKNDFLLSKNDFNRFGDDFLGFITLTS